MPQRVQGLVSKVLKGHQDMVFCVNYNSTSNLLVSGGCDGSVKIWNAAKGMLYLTVIPSLLPTQGDNARKVHEDP